MRIIAMLVVSTVLVPVGSVLGACCGSASKAPCPTQLAAADEVKAPAAVAAKAQTVCPVMGEPIDRNVFVDYNGKRVYFCCTICQAKFKKDPAKYLKKLENDGVTLEDAPAASK